MKYHAPYLGKKRCLGEGEGGLEFDFKCFNPGTKCLSISYSAECIKTKSFFFFLTLFSPSLQILVESLGNSSKGLKLFHLAFCFIYLFMHYFPPCSVVEKLKYASLSASCDVYKFYLHKHFKN